MNDSINEHMQSDTNFNLTISQNDGDTSKTTTVSSNTPEELLRILQLAGNEDAMGHDHSEGGSCSVCGGGAMEAMEEDIQVENDPRSEPQVMSAGDNVVAHRKKQPATRHIAHGSGDNPYVDAAPIQERLETEYAEYLEEEVMDEAQSEAQKAAFQNMLDAKSGNEESTEEVEEATDEDEDKEVEEGIKILQRRGSDSSGRTGSSREGEWAQVAGSGKAKQPTHYKSGKKIEGKEEMKQNEIHEINEVDPGIKEYIDETINAELDRILELSGISEELRRNIAERGRDSMGGGPGHRDPTFTSTAPGHAGSYGGGPESGPGDEEYGVQDAPKKWGKDYQDAMAKKQRDRVGSGGPEGNESPKVTPKTGYAKKKPTFTKAPKPTEGGRD